MTKQITENTGLVIRWGVISAAILSVLVWFNTRISAVEISQAEQKSDIRHVLDAVTRIESKLDQHGK